MHKKWSDCVGRNDPRRLLFERRDALIINISVINSLCNELLPFGLTPPQQGITLFSDSLRLLGDDSSGNSVFLQDQAEYLNRSLKFLRNDLVGTGGE